MLRAYYIAPNSDVRLSWGTQMPKSDKKENIRQLEGNSLVETSNELAIQELNNNMAMDTHS